MYAVAFLLVLGALIHPNDGYAISSCPAYGCRPSGTFSVLLKLPSNQPKVIWNTTYGPIQNCLGCVGNINNIVCPYKGLRLDGYVSIDSTTGKQVWYDGILHNPSLPVMDIEGDVIGTDGHNLIKVLADGTLVKPAIPISPFLYPLYSVQLSENGFLFFASEAAIVFAYGTDGIVLASIPLSGAVDKTNGTFVPITTPLVVGSRAYVLTEFKAKGTGPTSTQNDITLRRLYAIGIYARMVDRLHIEWHFDFMVDNEKAIREPNSKNTQKETFEIDMSQKKDYAPSQDDTLKFKTNPPDIKGDNLIMVDTTRQLIYAILPGEEGNMFWAIKDEGSNSSLFYKRTISASKMAMYEINGSDKKDAQKAQNQDTRRKSILFHNILPGEKRDMGIQIWLLSESKSIIYKIMPENGSIEATFNVSNLLGGQAEVTSDIMVSRDSDDDIDNVVYGVTVMKKSKQNYVVSMDGNGKINWMVPSTSNAVIIGQIAGISAEGSNADDMFVAFGLGDGSESSVVFGIQ